MAKQTQAEKFKQAARQIGTDNDEKRFNVRLGKIVRQKPTAGRSGSSPGENKVPPRAKRK